MKEALEELNLGFNEILSFPDGKEALEAAKTNIPDIIITDVVMPHISGHELIERINAINPRCIYIMISGHDDFAYLQKAISLRVIGYILKPINYNELLLIIHNAIDEHQKNLYSNKILQRYKHRELIHTNENKFEASLLSIQEINNVKHRTIIDISCKYINDNYGSNIGATDIAEICNISTGYLSTIFKHFTNSTIPKYITNIRLQKAIELLKDPTIPISKIAKVCGFNNVNYFTRVFKINFGVIPTIYREENLFDQISKKDISE
jgi:YesN/AraC family two-component response regulator